MKAKTRKRLVRAALSATMLLSIGCSAGTSMSASTTPSTPATATQNTVIAPHQTPPEEALQPDPVPEVDSTNKAPVESPPASVPVLAPVPVCDQNSKRAGNCKSPGYDDGLAERIDA